MRKGKVLLVMVAVLAMAGAAGAQTEPEPFVCTGEAYTVRDAPADLYVINQTVSPFVFVPIREDMTGPFGANGAEIGIQVNNLGFNSSDGLLYAIAMPVSGNYNYGIIQIDSKGAVFPFPLVSGSLPAARLLAGDVTPEGNIFYINTYPSGTLYTVDLGTRVVSSLETSQSVYVADWAVNPVDGMLYGAAAENLPAGSTNAIIYSLDPATGIINQVGSPATLPRFVSGQPSPNRYYGGCWFKPDGTLVLYRNIDEIYEVDLSDLTVVATFSGGAGASELNDAAACALEPEPPCPVQTEPLCAGQTMDIGTVDVTNDDENLYVTFNIIEPGWYLDETHVAVGTSLDDIPQTKKGNPIPGQFPFACGQLEEGQTSCTATIPLGEWCDGQELYIAAHTAVLEVEGDGCAEQVFWANFVGDYDQGTLKNGGPVSATRDDPEAVFALDGTDQNGNAIEGNFYSLGFDMDADDEYADGWLRVGFGAPIYNGLGDDVVVQEVTNKRSSYPLEQVEVFGVDDGMAYSAGIFDNEKAVQGGDGFVTIGLPAGPMTFEFVELLDATDPGDHISTADGYDVDAVGACYRVVDDETAWGNGCDRDSEFPGKNWGTYFTYTVSSCASCPQPVKLAAVRFKSFANTGSNEVYLGIGDLGQAANRIEAGYVWSKPETYEIRFEYSPGIGLRTIYGPSGSGSPTLTQYSVPDPLPPMDSCEIIVADRDADSQVDFLDVIYDNDGSPVGLGDFTGDGTYAAYPFAFDGLDDGFVFTGTIELDDGPFGGDEKSKVEILCGQNLAP